MGMLLTYHEGYRPEAEKPADEKPKRRKAKADEGDKPGE